jgi:hypothetical protein
VSPSRGRAQQLYPVQAPFLASCLSLFYGTRYEWSRYLSPLGGRAITKRGRLQVSCSKLHPLFERRAGPVMITSGHSTDLPSSEGALDHQGKVQPH